MNRTCTLVILLFCCHLSFAQPAKKFSYLVVQFTAAKDPVNDRKFFVIKTENASFSNWYKLSDFSPRAKKDSTIAFYFNRTDSMQALYNYFRSINEGLLFLGENGWDLVSVNNNIQSEAGTQQRLFDKEVPYTKVNTDAVFYFKKPIGE